MNTAAPALPEALLETLVAAGAPDWYLQAISHPTTTHDVNAPDGTRIHCVFWNEADVDKPPLLLVHGFRAHTHAWDPIAPQLTQHFRVLAVDLVGMGLSGRRADYGPASEFANDLPSVIEGLRLGPVTLVGHSFGGACSIHLAHSRPDLVRRLVVIDSTILFPQLDRERLTTQVGSGGRPYPDYEIIIGRYRLLPPQPCPPWALAFMAHHSVQPVPGGWGWKFDSRLPASRLVFTTQVALRDLAMPSDYVCGGQSAACEPRRLRLIEEAIGQGRPAVIIPAAHHHIMLDQPMALVGALRDLLCRRAEDPGQPDGLG